jgi:hypothetical protein
MKTFHQLEHPLMIDQIPGPGLSSGKEQMGKRPGIDPGKDRFTLNLNVMGTGNALEFEPGHGGFDPGPAQNINNRNGFDLFKSGGQNYQNLAHILFLVLITRLPAAGPAAGL